MSTIEETAFITGVEWGKMRGEINRHVEHVGIDSCDPWIVKTLTAALNALEDAEVGSVDLGAVVDAWNEV